MKWWAELLLLLAVAAVVAGAFALGEAVGEDRASRRDSFDYRWREQHRDGGAQ